MRSSGSCAGWCDGEHQGGFDHARILVALSDLDEVPSTGRHRQKQQADPPDVGESGDERDCGRKTCWLRLCAQSLALQP
jgi:hypothetical protein